MRSRPLRIALASGLALCLLAGRAAEPKADAKAAAPYSLVPAPGPRTGLIGEPTFRHGSGITHILPLPDGRRLLSTAADGSARLWAVDTGAELRRYCHPAANYVWNAALLADGRELLTCGGDHQVVRWDLETGKVLARYAHPDSVFRLAVAPDGRRFVTAGANHEARLWDVATGAVVTTFAGHSGSVYTAAFSADGQTLATGSADESIRLWDVATGQSRQQFERATGDVFTVARSPVANLALVCCDKRSVWLLNLESGAEVWAAGLPKGVHCAAWSPDGRRVAAACENDKVYLLDGQTGATQRLLSDASSWAVAFTPDGQDVWLVSGHRLRRGTAPPVAAGLPTQTQAVTALAVTPDAQRAYAVCDTKGVAVGDRAGGRWTAMLLPDQAVTALAVTPDGQELLAGGEDGVIRRLALPAGEAVGQFNVGADRITTLALSADGRLLLVPRGQDGLSLWRLPEGLWVHTFGAAQGAATGDDGEQAERPELRCFAFSSDGQWLAAAYAPHDLTLWNVPRRCQQGQLQVPPAPDAPPDPEHTDAPVDPVRDCVFVPGAPPGLLVATDRSLRFWAAPTPAAAALAPAAVAALMVQLGAASFKERRAAAAQLEAGGAAVLPQLEAAPVTDPEVRANLRAITSAIRAQQSFPPTPTARLERPGLVKLTLHPDGRRWAALQGKNSETRLILGRVSTRDLRVVAEIADPNGANLPEFTADGTLFVGNDNGTVSVYPDTPDVWPPPPAP